MMIRKITLFLVSFVIATTTFALAAPDALGCQKISHKRRVNPHSPQRSHASVRKAGRAERKPVLLAKNTRAANSRTAPPARVRIIDTGKGNSDQFPMPEINEWRANQKSRGNNAEVPTPSSPTSENTDDLILE